MQQPTRQQQQPKQHQQQEEAATKEVPVPVPVPPIRDGRRRVRVCEGDQHQAAAEAGAVGVQQRE